MKRLFAIIALTSMLAGCSAGYDAALEDADDATGCGGQVVAIDGDDSDFAPIGTQAEGTHSERLIWADGEVSVLALEVRIEPGTETLYDAEVWDTGSADVWRDFCGDRVEADVTLSLRTSDGRLDATVPGLLIAQEGSSPQLSATLDVSEIRDPTAFGLASGEGELVLTASFTSEGVEGTLLATVFTYEQGSTVPSGADVTTVAWWPGQ